jgi:hypothetical protein
VEDVAAMYAPDGMRMPPNVAAVKGREADRVRHLELGPPQPDPLGARRA